mmetsp:Transcript_28396/g.27203  ORF Transcript_28396/g.27203 Transcript_28396/m.27203 type:complete len:158 (+) Transcript_28396:290-763(+)
MIEIAMRRNNPRTERVTEATPVSHSALSDITISHNGSLLEFGTMDSSQSNITLDPYLRQQRSPMKKDSVVNRLFDYLNGTELHKTNDGTNANPIQIPHNLKRIYSQSRQNSVCEEDRINIKNTKKENIIAKDDKPEDQKDENEIEEGYYDLIFEIEL